MIPLPVRIHVLFFTSYYEDSYSANADFFSFFFLFAHAGRLFSS